MNLRWDRAETKRATKFEPLVRATVEGWRSGKAGGLRLPVFANSNGAAAASHPSDPPAARVAEKLLADPSDPRPLAELCRVTGAGKRTVERLFQEDMGMALGKWRQQLRRMQAMRL